MDATDIARVSARLQMLDEPIAQGLLQSYLTQLERLWRMIQSELTLIAGRTGSLVEFCEAMAQLKTFVESAREATRELENRVDDLYSSQRASYNAMVVVRTIIRRLLSELYDLSWSLAGASSRKVDPPPLDLTRGDPNDLSNRES